MFTDVDANESSKNIRVAALLTEGEQRLANFLKNNLPPNWKMYIKPYINGITPDFIVFNPEVGFMIYDVIENEKDYIHKRDNDSKIKKIDYINHYKDKIIRLIPDLGESINNNRSIYGVFKRGLYFHNMNGEAARKTFNHQHIILTGFDDLESKKIHQIVPGTEYRNSYMKKKWADELLFLLEPPLHPRKSRDFKLNDKQLKHAEPAEGLHRLRGPAGSGKTLVIAHRAARLASMGHKVLVVTYTRALWPDIKGIIKKTHFEFDWSMISFNHFHGLCKDVMASLKVYDPSDFNKENLEYLVSKVEAAVKNSDPDAVEKLKFDAILIDEGQDYNWESFNLLCKFLTNRKELLLVCDEKQNIFENDLSWIDNPMKGFKGDWGRLNKYYRFPKKMGDLVNKFCTEFDLGEHVDIESGNQKKLIKQNYYVRWDNIRGDEYDLYVIDAYNSIHSNFKSNNINDQDIAILLPSKKMGKKLLRFLRIMQIPVDHVFSSGHKANNKKLFDLDTTRLTVSTIHQFKGREASCIILLIPDKWGVDENLDAVVYTAMTRARKNLIVLNCNDNYWDFGEKISLDKIEIAIKNSGPIIQDLIQNLPSPFSYFLKDNTNNKIDCESIDDIFEFFNRFSEFICAVLLTYIYYLFPQIRKYRSFLSNPENYEWINDSSFDAWNLLGRNLTISIMRESHKTCINNNLKSIASLKLNDIFKEVESLKNIWKGLGAPESHREYLKRYKTLLKNFSHLSDQISNVFKNISLIVAYAEIEHDGYYQYKIKRFYGTEVSSTNIIFESDEKIDLNEFYILDESHNVSYKLFPLLLYRKNNCYFYDGKFEISEELFTTPEKAIYAALNNDLKDEIISFSKIDNFWLLDN